MGHAIVLWEIENTRSTRLNINSRLNYQLHGKSTLGYHIVNIICHAVATMVFYLFARLLEKRFNHFEVAFSSAVLFAVHPVHTEAVREIEIKLAKT